jgi:hypothetical protein
MNPRAEFIQAFEDYQAGRLGTIAAASHHPNHEIRDEGTPVECAAVALVSKAAGARASGCDGWFDELAGFTPALVGATIITSDGYVP